MNSANDLLASIKEGAVERIRPKIMTVCAVLFGLLPIMWSPITQAGADVTKRIATPMVGESALQRFSNSSIYPVLFFVWKVWRVPRSRLT